MKSTQPQHLLARISRLSLLAVAIAAAGAHAESANDIEEMVITATKQQSTVATTAASVSVVGADALAAGGIADIGDMVNAIPNLSVGDQFGVARIFIRGIGMTSIDLGADGAVAVHQDGAILARPSTQMAGFYDLERVEVLRGPQGTLYGRGATAGAMDLITKRPTQELDGYARVTVGDYSQMDLEGAIGGGITDGVAGRIAFKKEKRDGYGENLFTGNDVDDRDAYAVRGGLLFDPTEDLSIYLTAEHYEEDDNNYAFHYFGTSVTPEDQLAHNLLGGKTIFDIKGPGTDLGDLRDIYSDQDATNDRKGSAATAVIDYEIGGGWSLKSVTSWHDFERLQVDDLDVSDVWMFGQNNYEEESKTLSQEFTLNFDCNDYDLLFGAMAFDEEVYGSVKVPLKNLGLAFGAPADLFDNGNYWQNGDVDITAYGLFGQIRYELTDQLALTAGARWNYEERTGAGAFIFDAIGVNVPTDRKKDWDDVTPMVKLEYTTESGTLLYASYTEGFKSGVINVGSLNEVIDPEYVTAWEAGIKSRFLDDQLYLAAAVFTYDYKDLQVGFVNAQSIVETVNAAKAQNTGIEIEGSAQLTDAFSVDFFATHLEAEFEEFLQGDYRAGGVIRDLKGNNLPNAPENSFRVGVNYDISMGDSGSLRLRTDVNWQDEVFFTEFNNQDAVQDSYAMWNASIAWTSADEHWNATAWGRNLGDEDVIANNIVTAPLYGQVRVGSMMPPRTYGLTVGYDF
jgi:iron complex outermembrane receptor protein